MNSMNLTPDQHVRVSLWGKEAVAERCSKVASSSVLAESGGLQSPMTASSLLTPFFSSGTNVWDLVNPYYITDADVETFFQVLNALIADTSQNWFVLLFLSLA